MGVWINLLLRGSLVYFLTEVMLRPQDPRFAGKAIPIRNLLIVGGLSLLFPALYRLKRWPRYPWWVDNLHLSIFCLDMAGNSFNLYDRYTHFDLLPHFHGTGAAAIVAQAGFGASPFAGAGAATVLHTALEAQEYFTDVFFGTHNVRGVWDTVGDLTSGLAGVGAYTLLFVALKRRSARPR